MPHLQALALSLLLLFLPAALPLPLPPTTSIPSLHDSAILGRRLLTLSEHGTLSTIFRTSPPAAPNVAAQPIGLPDYVAACDPAAPWNPTLLALPIATSFRNALEPGSNISLSLQWVPPPAASPPARRPASLPRLALLGHLERIPERELRGGGVERCFVGVHPDARAWVPGNRIHRSEWVRLVVRHVYWVGGFGDRAFIGWIPVEEWRGVTEEEVGRVRLPGESEEIVGWIKWLFGMRGEL